MRASWITGFQALGRTHGGEGADRRHRAGVGDAALHGIVPRASASAGRRAVRISGSGCAPAAERVDSLLLSRSVLDRPAGRRRHGGRERSARASRRITRRMPPNLQSQLDLTERVVRIMQRGLPANSETQPSAPTDTGPGGIVTGFLLRSAAVSGWPSMDVRAFNTVLPANRGRPEQHRLSAIASAGSSGPTHDTSARAAVAFRAAGAVRWRSTTRVVRGAASRRAVRLHPGERRRISRPAYGGRRDRTDWRAGGCADARRMRHASSISVGCAIGCIRFKPAIRT